MKIIISKDSGEVVEVIADEDIGTDLDKPVTRQDLTTQIIRAIRMARVSERLLSLGPFVPEGNEWVPPTGTACNYFKPKGTNPLECHNCDFPKRLHSGIQE